MINNISLIAMNLIQFITPSKNNRFFVHFFDPSINTIDQLLFGIDSNMPQEGTYNFTKEHFNKVQPRTMFGSKNELKSSGHRLQIRLSFLRNMRRMIIHDQANSPILRINATNFFQEFDKFLAAMLVSHQGNRSAIMQVNTRQQRNGSLLILG